MSSKQSKQLSTCALCERDVQRITKHHLVPKSQGGREVADLCVPCHSTLHHFFENKTLAKELHSLETLRETPEIARYLQWVRKQPDTIIRVRRSKSRR